MFQTSEALTSSPEAVRCRGQRVHIYLFCLAFIVQLDSALSDNRCEYVHISGAMTHPSVNTEYKLDPKIHCNSRPVYVDQARKHYIYYLLDGYDGWMVAPTSCYHWGNFMLKAKTDIELPYLVAEGAWTEFDTESAEWKKSAELKVECADRVVFDWSVQERPYTHSPQVVGLTCDTTLCAANSHCITLESNKVKCVCNSGYYVSERHCVPDGISGKRLGILIVLSSVFLCCVALIIFLFSTYRTRLCPKTTADAPVNPDLASFKYRPLEKEDLRI